MPARLILNADDFGLTPSINRAIGELRAAGAITSATLMAAGPAFDDAVAVAHAHPSLGVGCHIVLVDGLPVSPPNTIPSLIGPDGKSFRPTLRSFLADLIRGRILAEDIAREALAQIEKLQRAGIRITHIDTHKHTHLGSPARRLAIRIGARLRPRFEALLGRHTGIRSTDGTIAISTTGQFNSARLVRILAALPPTGTYELCCHPGYNSPDLDLIRTRLRGHRDVERQALLTEIPRVMAQSNAPILISYCNLADPTQT